MAKQPKAAPTEMVTRMQLIRGRGWAPWMVDLLLERSRGKIEQWKIADVLEAEQTDTFRDHVRERNAPEARHDGP